MDTILSSLPPELLRFVEDQLTNNEVSDDEELREHFIANRLTEDVRVPHKGNVNDHVTESAFEVRLHRFDDNRPDLWSVFN